MPGKGPVARKPSHGPLETIVPYLLGAPYHPSVSLVAATPRKQIDHQTRRYFVLHLRDVSRWSMASVPDERQSGTLECSTEMDVFAESDTQIGGGCREPSPVIVTPTRLRQKIKATGRDTGLVREASFRRSQLPKPATPPSASKDTTIDDDPFLFSNCDEDRSSDLRHQVPER
ncbi:hypothetical protein EDD15DRAFT_2193869 [Pisolithus albus]|nr:hypothetical protein EDD15DRAFT_2193869 [Pisolithus albus]